MMQVLLTLLPTYAAAVHPPIHQVDTGRRLTEPVRAAFHAYIEAQNTNLEANSAELALSSAIGPILSLLRFLYCMVFTNHLKKHGTHPTPSLLQHRGGFG